MKFLQKTKYTLKFRYISWSMYLISFTGILVITLILLIGDGTGRTFENSAALKLPLSFFVLLFILGFIHHYLTSKHNDIAMKELSRSIANVEEEIGASLMPIKPNEMDIMAVSAVLNHSLQSLNEKNIRLKYEMERNERLSENISEFYQHMRTLREADFKFDFYEYDIKNSVFIFLSGNVTAIGDEELNEIPGQDLFTDYSFTVSYDEFLTYVNNSIRNDIPIDFECSMKGKEGNIRWIKFWGRVSKDQTRITGAITDITREIIAKNIEKERAIHDNITGFYNRNALSEVAGKAIEECGEGESVVFVYIGLTGYQEFQERFGMVAGNSYIRVCAEVFKKFLNSSMIPLRWWGSDFLLLVKGVTNLETFRKDTISVIKKVEKYIGEVDGVAVTFPLAIGYAASGIHGNTPAELLEYAAFAEHEALREVAMSPNEFNRERFDEAHKAALRRTFIKDIIDHNQLSVVFQPIVSLRTGELFGFEALSRPMNPIYSNILELIDDAEASGHYVILEKRMVYNALDAYMARDSKFRDHYLFINTAPYATLDEKDYNDIRDRYFGHMKVVFEVVERNRIDPEEINLRKSIVTKAGAKFALDDFGTGYSNHLALLSLEPDIIKIDRELISGIDQDLRKQHMLEDIVSYARYRGTRVLAEGVETQGELETLCRMGIDYVQGFFIGKPNPVLLEPDVKAQEIIRSISHNNQISMRQVFIIVEKSLSWVDGTLSQNLSITTFLTLRLAKHLGYEGEKLAGLVITSMFNDIGVLYPGCESRRSGDDEVTEHNIIAYLLLKEFSPYPEYARVILYHHKKYNIPNRKINNISVSDEAYMLSLAAAASDIILENKNLALDSLYEKVMAGISRDEYKPEYAEALKMLCDEEILQRISSGEYRLDLLNYMNSLKLSKAEIEGLIRTYIYAITFRTPLSFSHPKTMETIASILGRMTKQNWNLLEKVRIASLLFNLGMLTMDRNTFNKRHSPEELHKLLKGAIVKINAILEEAELFDIMDMFNGIIGEKPLSENRLLMGKDIINGSNMLNIADIFASLMEEKSDGFDISCPEALDELKRIAKSEKLYLPMIELMEDYTDDIEACIKSSHAAIAKHRQNIVSNFETLTKCLLSGSPENSSQ